VHGLEGVAELVANLCCRAHDPFAALLAAAAEWLIGRAVLRPLDRLATGAAAIEHNPDPARRLPSVSHPDEVAALSTTLNGMLDRLGASTETTRRFTADVGHELRTPLAATGTYPETLQADPTVSGPARESVDAMAAQHHRMVALIEGLQALARAEAGAFPGDKEVEIGTLVEELTGMARRRHPDISYEFTDTSDGASITGWRDGLRIAVDNLLDNAAHHGRPGGHVSVTVELDHPDTATVTPRKDHRERIRITIGDDGPGIPQELHDTLRQRFTRGPGSRTRGSGLGLALVEQQANLHGGTLRLDTSDEGGLAITITITNATG
jgi:two-component system sensor histidine kinase PrrB